MSKWTSLSVTSLISPMLASIAAGGTGYPLLHARTGTRSLEPSNTEITIDLDNHILPVFPFPLTHRGLM